MRRLGRAFANAGFFLVCYAALPLLAGQMIMGNCYPPLIALLIILALSVLLSFLPGRIGGGRRDDVVSVVRSTHGSDPDPDRALRNEALPAEEKKSFPLRAFVGLICFLAIGVAVFIRSEGDLPLRILLALLVAVMLPLSLRVVALDGGDTVSVLAGVIMYAVAGVIGYGMKDETFNRMIMIFGMAFLLTTALGLNNQSMANGATVRAGVKPPASMRRRNRVMLLVMAFIGAIILYLDQIRMAAIALTKWVGRMLKKIYDLLFYFFPDSQTGSGGGGGNGELELTLSGSPEDYRITPDKGVGEALLNGEKMLDGETYGNGENRVELNGGVGSMWVLFDESQTITSEKKESI